MMKEELNEIIRLSELCGRWTQFFDGIDWDHPKLLIWQKQAQQVRDKRDKLLAEFLDDCNNNSYVTIKQN